MKRHLALITLSILSLQVQAGVSKWVDAEGKVHYSDSPPAEAATKQTVRNIAGKGPAETSPAPAAKSYAEREVEIKKTKQDKEQANQDQARQEANAEVRKQNCSAAKARTRLLTEGGRIVTYDENGERTYIDDDARAQRLAAAHEDVSENCD